MSVDDDTELKDLLVQVLEKNGTLAKIRNKAPLLNERAREFADTQDGRLCAEIVADFLESLNLDASLSVFMAEFELLQRRPRASLASALGLPSVDHSVPLLSAVLKGDSRGDKNNEVSFSPSSKQQPTSSGKSKPLEEDFVNGAKHFGSKPLDNEEDSDEKDDFFDTGKKDHTKLSGIPSTVTVRHKTSIGSTDGDGGTKRDSTVEPKKDDLKSPKSAASSRGHLADLPDLSTKNRSPFPSVTNEKRPKDLDFMKLLGESLDDTDRDTSPGNSARKVPALDLKSLYLPKSNGNNRPENDAGQSMNGDSSRKEVEEKSRKDSSADDEISEELEDLEAGDLDSGRSSRKFSF